MASVNFKTTEDGISIELDKIVQRGRSMAAFLNRYIYPSYQMVQIKRWESENATEGSRWKPLEPNYARRKRKRFAAYPGAGRAIMVATGKLAFSAQGRKNGLKIVTDNSMTVGIDVGEVPYAIYPGKDRPFMVFSRKTLQDWSDRIYRYMMTGEVS